MSGAKLFFWGASNWIERTLDNILIDAAYIVDKNESNQGSFFGDLPVKAPDVLVEEARGTFCIIITTANYPSVIDEVTSRGLIMGDDYCCTPLLNERRNKDDLKAVNKTVLLSSPMHYSDELRGGGLYAVQTQDGSVQKVYSGKGRGISRRRRYFTIRYVAWFDCS